MFRSSQTQNTPVLCLWFLKNTPSVEKNPHRFLTLDCTSVQRSKVALSLALTSKRSLQFDRGFWYLFLSMPMKYATSVGVLLFGIEKESRSLQRMRSLPTYSKQIAWNELVVAIGTLALVWLIASAIALLAVAILVWQWIVWERTIAENEEPLRSASEAIFQTPAEPLAEIIPKT